MIAARLKSWPQYLLPQHGLTRLATAAANSRWLARPLIGAFSKLYPVRLDECQCPAGGFDRFDAFFTRHLRAGVRSFPDDPDAIVSPCDGTLSRIGSIDQGDVIQAKGRRFSVEALLGAAEWAAAFDTGRFATIYLAPHDYHRVHMPIAGSLVADARIPGRLFSVSHATSLVVDRLYARNERMVAVFETAHGPVAVVMVAAMLVAGIETVWDHPEDRRPASTMRKRTFDTPVGLERGAQLGCFHWGSTVIVLTGSTAPAWDERLGPGQQIRLGTALTRPLRAPSFTKRNGSPA